MVGMVLAEPPVIVTEPCALRKPLAVATTTYVPAGACKVKVPSELAFTVAANELSVLYKLTVTGLLAFTWPIRDPVGIGVADAVGVDVKVGVGDTSGVNVNVGVGDTAGVDVSVAVAVAEPFGVEVAVSEPFGVEVAVSDPFGVEVTVADPSGVDVAVADPFGVEVAVADPLGVEVNTGVADAIGVKVGATPTTLKLAAPVDERLVSTLSPFETRAVHSIAACPASKPFTLKVNAVPLVVALLPLLPAIAKIKLPFVGPFIATAGSAPKRPATATLLDSNKLGS